jgi:hypothetical protein
MSQPQSEYTSCEVRACCRFKLLCCHLQTTDRHLEHLSKGIGKRRSIRKHLTLGSGSMVRSMSHLLLGMSHLLLGMAHP